MKKIVVLAFVALLSGCGSTNAAKDIPLQEKLPNPEDRPFVGVEQNVDDNETGQPEPWGWLWPAATREQAEQLATKTQTTGELKETPDSEGGGWRIDDPQTQNWAHLTKTGEWNAGGTTTQTTEKQIVETAETLFGENVELHTGTIDENGGNIKATYLVDKQNSGWTGEYITSAQNWNARGVDGTPEKFGPYQLLTARQALERQNDERLVTITRSGPVDARDWEITGAKAAYIPYVDANNRMWSLPGYEYTTASGALWKALAVTGQHLQQPGQNEKTVTENACSEIENEINEQYAASQQTYTNIENMIIEGVDIPGEEAQKLGEQTTQYFQTTKKLAETLKETGLQNYPELEAYIQKGVDAAKKLEDNLQELAKQNPQGINVLDLMNVLDSHSIELYETGAFWWLNEELQNGLRDPGCKAVLNTLAAR